METEGIAQLVPLGKDLSRPQTRTQRIRTAGQIPFEAVLFEEIEPPVYQRIALEAYRLHKLGFNALRIAQPLRVTDKTVSKALRWFSRMKSN